jgi:hypothetical protein
MTAYTKREMYVVIAHRRHGGFTVNLVAPFGSIIHCLSAYPRVEPIQCAINTKVSPNQAVTCRKPIPVLLLV